MQTASQIIAALIVRLAPSSKSITLTMAELMAFETKWPTTVRRDDDGSTITVFVDPDALRTNPKLTLEE